VGANGWLTWTPKAAPVAAPPVAAPGAPSPKPKPKLTLPGKGKKIAEVEVPSETETYSVASVTSKPIEVNKKGRPKLGLVLRLGCSVVKGPQRKMLTIQDVLAMVGSQLAEAKGAENYYLLNAFERRDLIAANVEGIAEELGSVVVVGSACCPDTRALYSALVSVSEDVVEGPSAA
jgi:hypothetical protein